MATRFPLQTLHDLSQLRLDDATRRLGELIASEGEAKKRRDLLVEYRLEYQARFVSASQSGLGPRELHNYRSFLSKLDDAVDQAERQVAQSQARTAHGQKEWLNKRGDVKAYDTLSERHRQREQHGELRREQRQADEFAARRIDQVAGDDGA